MRQVKQALSETKPGWLILLCMTRVLNATISTAWAGVLPQVIKEWGLQASQAGLVQSAWHVGYLTSLFCVGFIADRVGPRKTFLVGSALTAVASLGFAFGARDLTSTALLFGLTGLFAGACYSPGLQLLAANAPPEQRGKAMGAFIGSSSLGYALSLAVVAGLTSMYSWRIALIAVGLLVTAGAVLTAFALKRMRADPIRHRSSPPVSIPSLIMETVRDRPAMAGNWAYAAHCWELLALWAWLPAYLAFCAGANGLSSAQGLALAAVAHMVSVAGSVVGGAASDRFGRTRVMMFATCTSLTCSFAFGWLWSAPMWTVAIFGALYNMCAIADSSVYSTALADVVPPERLGVAFSVRSVLGFGAGAISPWVFGVALDWGHAAMSPPDKSWILAWATVGLGGLIGPWMILRFSRFSGAIAR